MTEMPMRERVAKAIHDTIENDDDSGGGAYLRAVDAVLEAMRTATRGMASAGRAHHWGTDRCGGSTPGQESTNCAEIYAAMIAAAKDGK